MSTTSEEAEFNATRAERSCATFEQARTIAHANGLTLTNPSDGCYQLRAPAGWIINMYPRSKGCSPRMYHDPHRPGPFLRLPENWTLLDAVRAAIESANQNERED